MFELFKRFLNSEKRSAFFNSGAPFRQSGQILRSGIYDHPIIQLAIRIYTDQLAKYPLRVCREKEKVNHPLLRVFQKPNSWQSGTQLFAIWGRNIIAGGQACNIIKWDHQGRITEILPFAYSQQCFAYPRRGGEYSDPEGLKNYYFQANGKNYHRDSILQIKDLAHSSHDLLNAYPRLSNRSTSFLSGLSLSESLYEISRSQIISPDLFSASAEIPAEIEKAFIERVDAFWQQNIGTRKRSKIFPPGFSKMQQTKDSSISSLTPDLKKISDLDIARAYGISFLIQNFQTGPQSSIKEIMRGFHFDIALPWLKHVSAQLSNQLLSERERDRGFRIEFETGIGTSDKREISTYLKALRETGLISQNEARSLLGLPIVKGAEHDSLSAPEKEKNNADKYT